MAVNKLNRNIPVVDVDGKPLQNLQILSEQVAAMEVLVGTGTPEGAVEAFPPRLYIDLSSGAGSGLYAKQLADIGGNKKLGWVMK